MNVFARLLVLGSLPVVCLAAGCTSQGEGDRCAVPADCQSGLFCFFPTSAFGVCCSTNSTVAACNPGVTTADASTLDAAAETSTEEAAAEAEASSGEEASTEDAAPDGAAE
jgi:hypothetical protein